MTKEDLQLGMIVKLRNGDLCLLEPNNNYYSKKSVDNSTRLRNIKNAIWVTNLSGYYTNLKEDDDFFNEYDIMAVYEDYTLSKLLWERKEIILNDHEKKVLQALKVLGLGYIARDDDDNLFAYNCEPNCSVSGGYYENDDICFVLDNTLFQFIKPMECKAIEEIEEYE